MFSRNCRVFSHGLARCKSQGSEVFPAPQPHPLNVANEKDVHGDKATIQKLAKKVEDLEHKISLLTVGMLRDRSKTTEDICGTGNRFSRDASSEESPVAPVRTTKSDRMWRQIVTV